MAMARRQVDDGVPGARRPVTPMTEPAAGGAEPFTMVLFHAALMRDLRRARHLLTDGELRPGGRRARQLGRHLVWLMDALRIHHEGEDAHLWPLLRERVPWCSPVLEAMLTEHHTVDEPVARLHAAAQRLSTRAPRGVAADLDAAVRAIDELVPPLEQHLDHEERAVLPIVTRAMTQPEWQAFEKRAWSSRRPRRETPRFVVWLLDGVRWTPEVRTRFTPAAHIPGRALRALSAAGHLPGVTPWSGTSALRIRPLPTTDRPV